MKYALDFDGVIARRNGIPTTKEFTKNLFPNEGAKEAINWLLKCGHELYIFTTHEPIDEVYTWLEENDFPRIRTTNIKESGTKAFVDDRAIRFTNWNDIRKFLE